MRLINTIRNRTALCLTGVLFFGFFGLISGEVLAATTTVLFEETREALDRGDSTLGAHLLAAAIIKNTQEQTHSEDSTEVSLEELKSRFSIHDLKLAFAVLSRENPAIATSLASGMVDALRHAHDQTYALSGREKNIAFLKATAPLAAAAPIVAPLFPTARAILEAPQRLHYRNARSQLDQRLEELSHYLQAPGHIEGVIALFNQSVYFSVIAERTLSALSNNTPSYPEWALHLGDLASRVMTRIDHRMTSRVGSLEYQEEIALEQELNAQDAGPEGLRDAEPEIRKIEFYCVLAVAALMGVPAIAAALEATPAGIALTKTWASVSGPLLTGLGMLKQAEPTLRVIYAVASFIGTAKIVERDLRTGVNPLTDWEVYYFVISLLTRTAGIGGVPVYK